MIMNDNVLDVTLLVDVYFKIFCELLSNRRKMVKSLLEGKVFIVSSILNCLIEKTKVLRMTEHSNFIKFLLEVDCHGNNN